MRADSTTAGRRPACSVPLTGSNSTQAMSPASGSIFPARYVFRCDVTARISIVDDLGPDIRPPIDELRLVVTTDALHLRDQIFEPIACSRVQRLEAQFASFDLQLKLSAL